MIKAIILAVVYNVCYCQTSESKFNKIAIGSRAFVHDTYKIDDNLKVAYLF